MHPRYSSDLRLVDVPRVPAPLQRIQPTKVWAPRCGFVSSSILPLTRWPGCQIPYIPISLQYPEHVHELQTRQLEATLQQAWFPCSSAPSSPCILEPTIDAVAELEQALLAAMDAPLETPPPNVHYSPAQIKTSESHPIKSALPRSYLLIIHLHPLSVSMLIPPELLPLVSSHLAPRLPPHPTLFTLPPVYTLDRLTSAPAPHPLCLPPPPPPPLAPPRSPTPSLSRARARGAISQLLFKRGLARENPLVARRIEDDVDTPRPSSPASAW